MSEPTEREWLEGLRSEDERGGRVSEALAVLIAEGGEIKMATHDPVSGRFYVGPVEPGRYLVCRLDSDGRDTGEKP